MVLTRRPSGQVERDLDDLPFWVVTSRSPEIIDGHDGIGRVKLMYFLRQLFHEVMDSP